jgi:membrane protein
VVEDQQPAADEPPSGRLATQIASARAQGEHALEWGRTRVTGVDAAVDTLTRERLGGGSLLAGGLAYRLFFWLVPLGLVAAALLSFWVDADSEGFEHAAEELGMGAAAAHSASEAIAAGAHSRWYFLIAGIVFVEWFSIGVVRALRLAYALAWQVELDRMERPMLAGAVFTTLAVVLTLTTGSAAWLREQTGVAGAVATLVIVAVYAGVALWMMSLLPHREAPTRALLPGALLVALGTQAIHLFVVVYLVPRLGRSSELYGSLGAATVILVWLYVTARLVVAGAFLNATVWRRRHSRAAGPAG